MVRAIADSNKVLRGRPPTGIGPAIGLRLYPELARHLDEWIAAQPDGPSRPEAIRRLMAIGLAVSSEGVSKGPAEKLVKHKPAEKPE